MMSTFPGMKTRIIGLGNPIVADEAAGLHVARALRPLLQKRADEIEGDVDVMESETAGFKLMDEMNGWDRVIIIDAIHQDNTRHGAVVRLTPEEELPSIRLRVVHELDLPSALKLGASMGYDMPQEVIIFGIQAKDEFTFSEALTPPVADAVPKVTEMVLAELCHQRES